MSASRINVSVLDKKQIICITDNSARMICKLLQEKEQYIGIRIKVLNNKGCFGKSYHVEYVQNPDKYDEIVLKEYKNNLIKVFIDPKTMLSIQGSTVDYVEEKFGSGFVFNNPRENGRCGCGKSFN